MAPGSVPPGLEILATYEAATQMLEGMVAFVHKAWDGLINAVRDLLQRAQHFLNSDSLWSTIMQRITHHITEAIDTIVGLINRLQPEVDKIFTTLEQGAANAVPVMSLFRTALTLDTTIMDGVSGLSADMTAYAASDASGYGDIQAWRGPAKLNFDKRVQDQMGAADAVTEKIKSTAGWLAGVGASNTAYVTNIGHMAAELAGQLVTAAIDASETAAGDIPQYIIALQHLSEVIGTAVAHTIDWALDLNQHFADTLKQITDLTGDMHDKTGFGVSGAWPAAAGMP